MPHSRGPGRTEPGTHSVPLLRLSLNVFGLTTHWLLLKVVPAAPSPTFRSFATKEELHLLF